MNTTATTETATFDAATCSYADLRAKAIELSIRRRTQMKAAELRAAVAAELAHWTAINEAREATMGVDLNITAPEPQPTPEVDETTVQIQVIERDQAREDLLRRIALCPKADEHIGVGSHACGWSQTSAEVIAKAQAAARAEQADEVVPAQVVDTLVPSYEAKPAIPSQDVRPVTRGRISTTAFRAAHGRKPSTMGGASWVFFRADDATMVREFHNVTWYQAAEMLLSSVPTDTKWVLGS